MVGEGGGNRVYYWIRLCYYSERVGKKQNFGNPRTTSSPVFMFFIPSHKINFALVLMLMAWGWSRERGRKDEGGGDIFRRDYLRTKKGCMIVGCAGIAWIGVVEVYLPAFLHYLGNDYPIRVSPFATFLIQQSLKSGPVRWVRSENKP